MRIKNVIRCLLIIIVAIICTACTNTKKEDKVSYVEGDMIYDLRYCIDSTGTVEFNWRIVPEYENEIDEICINIANGDETETIIVDSNKSQYMYKLSVRNCTYNFSFIPKSKGKIGNTKECSCFMVGEMDKLDFPYVEIVTRDAKLPTYEIVKAPSGAWGQSIINNESVDCTIKVYNENNKLLYSSSNNYNGAQIRVRGNTSANDEKTPYKIDLAKKADMLEGLVDRDKHTGYESKDWVLLKVGNYLKHAVGSTVSEVVGMEYVPAYRYVALFVNGDYRGIYILTENVKRDEERCNVEDNGYIVELDSYWWNEPIYFDTSLTKKRGIKYTFKYPSMISEDSKELEYIQDYISQYEDLIVSGEDASDYIDIESYAKWLYIHDVLGTTDSGGANIYLLKKDNTSKSKLTMGVLWDYDTTMGSQHKYAQIRNEKWFVFKYLLNTERFNKIYADISNKGYDIIPESVNEVIEKYNTESYDEMLELEEKRYTREYKSAYDMCREAADWIRDQIEFLRDDDSNIVEENR